MKYQNQVQGTQIHSTKYTSLRHIDRILIINQILDNNERLNILIDSNKQQSKVFENKWKAR